MILFYLDSQLILYSFYFDNFLQGGLKSVSFANIVSVNIEVGKRFTPDKLVLNTRTDDYILDACIDGVNISVLKNVFNHIIEKSKEGEFNVSEQGLMLCQIPEEIKLLYLEILCNYALINDQVIDPDEYNAIMKFSIRMEIQGDSRAKLRKYMNDPEHRFKTGTLLTGIKDRTINHTGIWEVVRYCLMQDVLYIHDIQAARESWREDGFIGSLMEHCSLNEWQLDSMTYAVSLNKKLLKRDADMSKVKAEWKEFITSIKGKKGYVPTPYLFCSGSVYGAKSYEEFIRKDELGQSAINKQRELILQEIIMNNQKTVNVLIGDMNYLAERVEEALIRENHIEREYDRIKQLLSRVKSALKSVEQREECEESIKQNYMYQG